MHHPRMPRSQRPHLPGVPFHLTARLQDGKNHFLGMEATVARLIHEEADRADGELLAYAVMPNHLHLVFVQGVRPLATLMQPLLRRLALRVQKKTSGIGHVFGGPYWSVPCTDPDYLRNAIAYVHLNPVRAGLCKRPDAYEWTSHASYCSAAGDASPGRNSGLLVFACESRTPPARVRLNYRAFLEWRVNMDEHIRVNGPEYCPDAPRAPKTDAGDLYWAERFGWGAMYRTERQRPRRPSPDLRDLALHFLDDREPGMPLELLRSGQRMRPLVAVRREFILRAKQNGHRNRTIARFLRISDVSVSRI